MSQTVIDELVVRLGLDPKEFRKGANIIVVQLDKVKDKARKDGKDIEQSGKRAAEFFGQMERAALKFFTVFTVGRGFTAFTQSVISTGANISRLSRNLGLSADTLSRWGDAVAKNGGSVEGFQGTIRTLSKAVTEFNTTGTSSMLPLFNMLGISLVDSEGKAKQLDTVLADLGEGFKRRYANRSDAFNIAQQFGIDEGTFNLLMKSQAEIRKELAAQKGLNDQQAKAAERAERKWLDVQTRIEATTRELVYKLLPAIEKLADAMAKFAEVSVPVLVNVVDWLGKAHDLTGGWSTALLGVLATLRLIGGVSLASLIAQLGKVGAAVGATTAAGAGAASGGLAARVLGSLRTLSGGAGLSMLFASEGVNAGEDERMAALQAQYAAGQGGSVASGTRGARNNNPGNLEFHGQAGATREAGSGRFAKFGSMAQGVAALGRQLQLYGSRGVNTLRGIISRYAPGHENDTASYIRTVSRMTGFGADQQLNLNDAGTLGLLIRGISTVENGSNIVGREDMLSGLKQLRERPAQGAAPISIGQVTIHTQSTDAEGIARDFRAALIRQADMGMR